MPFKNTLYYGENLEILKKHVPDESIDLIYLDPPFNSKATYNLLFKEPTGEISEAQISAFEDTWHWTTETEETYGAILDDTNTPSNVSEMMRAFLSFIKRNDMMAYLTMMCARLLELKRVLKPTGSVYLHCDPTASHYLKILMDTIFGKKNYRNELVWCYEGRELNKKEYNRKHDIILFYSKSDDWKFNWQEIAEPLKESSRIALARYKDKKGWFIVRYKKGGGFAPLEEEGPDTYRQYVPTGVPPRDWMFIDYERKRKRLGYPTQKPEALLERLIRASSDKGEIILDPFCGCGTATAVSQKLERNWIGIDITYLAINLVKLRMFNQFGLVAGKDYQVVGEPADLASARELAKQDRYQFQWWVTSLLPAHPYGEKKKGADTGIDGIIYFSDEKDKHKKVIVQVKSGAVGVKDIRDLSGVMQRENAEIGILVTLEQPTKPMRDEAFAKGVYRSALSGAKYQRIQILTVEELLSGKKPNLPTSLPPFKRALRYDKNAELANHELFDDVE